MFSKVEMEFGTAQDSARDLAEHFGVWLKRGVKKNLLCVFHKERENWFDGFKIFGLNQTSGQIVVHSNKLYGPHAFGRRGA